MNGNGFNKQGGNTRRDVVDRLLRAGASREVSEGTGRVKARVLARIAVSAAPTAQSRGWWHGGAGWLLPVAAVLAMAVGVWLASQGMKPTAPESRGALRLTAALDGSVAALRGARPEKAIVVEAKRLKADVERGVGFVKSVLPRIRANG